MNEYHITMLFPDGKFYGGTNCFARTVKANSPKEAIKDLSEKNIGCKLSSIYKVRKEGSKIYYDPV